MDGGWFLPAAFKNGPFYPQSNNCMAIKHLHPFALCDADFDPEGRNQHPARQSERILT